MKTVDETVWMSSKEVMGLLQCSKGYVLKLARDGRLARRQTGAHKRYSLASVEALVRSQATEAAR